MLRLFLGACSGRVAHSNNIRQLFSSEHHGQHVYVLWAEGGALLQGLLFVILIVSLSPVALPEGLKL